AQLPVVETDQPRVTQVYVVRPDILAIQIETGKIEKGGQVPYVADVSDRIAQENNGWLKRDGQLIGAVVGRNKEVLTQFDQFSGEALETEVADQPETYSVTASGRRATTSVPEAVYRKSKPTDMAWVGPWQFEWPMAHTVFLDMPDDLVAGETYTVDLAKLGLDAVEFEYLPDRVFSEAVHVSQLGFRPDDPAKVGFLSTWLGSGEGLAYGEGLSFWLVDQTSAAKVYTGTTVLNLAANRSDDKRRNYNGTPVYKMDFSDFNRAGTYRLCVETIGCSFPFEVGETVWRSAFYTTVRGLYHQRSGLALERPYTDFERPRSFHPEDGMKFYQSTYTLLESGEGLGLGEAGTRDGLKAGNTGELVPQAWGGWFDAGDWDRRIQHVEASRQLLELAELFPAYFARVDLNLPESDNALPDVVDEALWNVDFFRRLQAEDGGISGGIESAQGPSNFAASWQEPSDAFVYAPDMWSSYLYAGVAAQAASVVSRYEANRAEAYRRSAVRAMEWAEAEYAQAEEVDWRIRSERNLAAVELYRLTGDRRWHDLFLATTVFSDPQAPAWKGKSHDQINAAFVYSRLSQFPVNAEVQQNAKAALLAIADNQVEIVNGTGFGWSKFDAYENVGWGGSFGAPEATQLLRAHFLTGDRQYLEAGVLANQFSAGANPDNLVYTTGLGQRSPQHPLVIDARVTGQAPPPGITVYGPIDLWRFNNYWVPRRLLVNHMSPSPWKWPTAEAYTDIFLYPAVSEFTIHQTIGPAAYARGYLAAREALAP
ncbi:MAG: glycoside hydrolase family 9 protein, partial [Almyronema sp.]